MSEETKIDVKIGSRLKTLRKQKKMTQKEVAQFLNISTMSYSRYEQDLRQPDFETLAKLGLLLKFDVGQLFLDGILHGKEYEHKYEIRLNEDFIYDHKYLSDLETAISQRSRAERRAVLLIFRVRDILKNNNAIPGELEYLEAQLKRMFKEHQYMNELIEDFGEFENIDDEIVKVLSSIKERLN